VTSRSVDHHLGLTTSPRGPVDELANEGWGRHAPKGA
jgi:hypothetical protein